jgi:hypothetical protein
LIEEIATKEELLNARDEIAKTLSDLVNQLIRLKEEVDFLIKYPKNRISLTRQSKNLAELKISDNVKVISIPEIKQKINAFVREYGIVKSDVNHTFSARTGFNLTSKEDQESREQKRKSDELQTDSNKLNNDLNDFIKWTEGRLYDSEGYPDGGGGMTQIDPPSLQLDAGPADTDIDSCVDTLQGIVVLC